MREKTITAYLFFNHFLKLTISKYSYHQTTQGPSVHLLLLKEGTSGKIRGWSLSLQTPELKTESLQNGAWFLGTHRSGAGHLESSVGLVWAATACAKQQQQAISSFTAPFRWVNKQNVWLRYTFPLFLSELCSAQSWGWDFWHFSSMGCPPQ